MTSTDPDAAAVARALGLGPPSGPLVAHARGSSRTWSLTTADGRFFVKDLPDGWDHVLGPAMAFEVRAARAGVAMPRPVVPPRPDLELAVRVPGTGLVRAHEWVDGRAVRAGDDVHDWLGATLAQIAALEPLDAAEPLVYGLHPRSAWAAWQADGADKGLAWAPVLADRLDDVAATSAWIAAAFAAAGGYAMAHRDVEPWNVLVTAGGPVLVDWDAAGPDASGLVAGHAAFAFGLLDGEPPNQSRPDPAAVRRTLAAYVAAGGGPLPADRDLFARRAALLLGRLAERIRRTLGHLPMRWSVAADLERQSVQRLTDLPAFVDRLRQWTDTGRRADGDVPFRER